MKKSLYLAAGAFVLTATIAMAEPKAGTPAAGGSPTDHPGGIGDSASVGMNAGSKPVADFIGSPYDVGAAGYSVLKSAGKSQSGFERALTDLPSAVAAPFALY